jgi:hypothetical protein
MDKNCSETAKWKQRVEAHPLTVSDTPALRSSLLRFKWQDEGFIHQRLERDMRPRGFERTLIRNHSKLKDMKSFEFPSFAIERNMVMRYNSDEV